MKLFRMLVAAGLVGGLAAVAMVAQQTAPVGAQMTEAAQKYLGSLSPELKKKGTFAYDDKERVNWFFTPRQDKERNPTRKGVRFGEMSADQKKLALELLRTGTSKTGFTQATTIMSLEGILAELEKKGAMVRDPNWYFVTVFGEPSKTGTWGWRIEGHHLSVNFTIDRGEVTSVTPFFFGANPADVMAGPKKGLRTLPAVEDLAFELVKSLDDGQKKVALQTKQFGEIEEKPSAAPGGPVGLPAAKMNDQQRGTLMKLLEAYANRMPPDLAAAELKRVKDAGIEKVHFAFAGAAQQGKPHTYRVQGPTFVIQFLNVQADSAGNPANHIHSVWRRLPADFGLKQRP